MQQTCPTVDVPVVTALAPVASNKRAKGAKAAAVAASPEFDPWRAGLKRALKKALRPEEYRILDFAIDVRSFSYDQIMGFNPEYLAASEQQETNPCCTIALIVAHMALRINLSDTFCVVVSDASGYTVLIDLVADKAIGGTSLCKHANARTCDRVRVKVGGL